MVARNEIEVLYSEERPGLLKRVARRLGSQSAAADVVQDVFLRLWERGTGSLDSDVAYLNRSVSNAIVDHVRAERVRSAYAANILPEQCSAPIPTPYELAEIRDTVRQLDDIIREMPERTRHIFLLNKVHGCKYSEIAEVLGISRSAVEKHMARAMIACIGFQERSL